MAESEHGEEGGCGREVEVEVEEEERRETRGEECHHVNVV